MFYTLTNRDGDATLSVIGENYEKVLASTHPNFEAVLSYLTHTAEHDEEHVQGLVDPAIGIGRALAEITDRVTFDMYRLYFDGAEVRSVLSKHIADKMRSKDQDWVRLVKFMLNVDANPSYHSQQEVYGWVGREGLTITPEGNFIGYKGVDEDGLSCGSGPGNYVDGVLVGADVHESVRVPNEVGTIVSIPRGKVDDNPNVDCSVGLHVGSYTYAKGFASRLLTVEVNPADVVSVPNSNSGWKIRVCKYKVLEVTPQRYVGPSFDPADVPLPDVDAWFINEDGGVYSYPSDIQEQDFPNDDHVPYLTEIAAQQAVNQGDEPARQSVVKTLAEHAAVNSALQDDLANKDLGHKALGRKYADITTESSVRRYRKSNGIKINFGAKVKDATS